MVLSHAPDAVAHVVDVAAAAAALQDGADVQVKPGHVRILLQAHHGAHALRVRNPAGKQRVTQGTGPGGR
jgi:hypothetical protein